MSIQMPDEFEDCTDNVVEFLDGGNDEKLQIAALFVSSFSELIVDLSTIVVPWKLGWFDAPAGTAANAAEKTAEILPKVEENALNLSTRSV